MNLNRFGEHHHGQRLRQTAKHQRVTCINTTAQDLADTGNHQVNRDHVTINTAAVHAKQLFRHARANRQNAGSHRPTDKQCTGTQVELATGRTQAISQ
ncbi:hypothetical protein D3C73_1373000 [compost metagenome]